MRRTAVILAGFIILLSLAATAQENRSEISIQGTGFFTQDSNGQGTSRTTTETGGFLVGYRYHFNRWLSGEANYGYDRDTQRYFSTGGFSTVESDVHTARADVVVGLPFTIARLNPYVLGGGGSLVFHPTGNSGGFLPGADTQAKGTFLYGAGVNYTLTKQPSLRAEYRAMSIKTPILGSEPLTRTVGPTRCNHQLELFSDSDRESWQAGPFPACHAFLIVE